MLGIPHSHPTAGLGSHPHCLPTGSLWSHPHSSHSQPGIPSAQLTHRGPGITFLQSSHYGSGISSTPFIPRGPRIPSTQPSHRGLGFYPHRHPTEVLGSQPWCFMPRSDTLLRWWLLQFFFQSLQYESSSKVFTSVGKSTLPRIFICSMPNLCSVYKKLRYFKKWTQKLLCYFSRTVMAVTYLIINSENVGGGVNHIGVKHPTLFSKTLTSCISQSVAGK